MSYFYPGTGSDKLDKKVETELSEEAVGKNKDVYFSNLKWLQNHWNGIDDNAAAREICPLIYNSIAPLVQAIIIDNLEFFKKEFLKEKVDASAFLPIAYLCGSQKIAEFLLKEMKQDYLSSGNDFILGYVSASQNIAWAKSIASLYVKSGREMPDSVRELAGGLVYKTLKEIFNKTINSPVIQVDSEQAVGPKVQNPKPDKFF